MGRGLLSQQRCENVVHTHHQCVMAHHTNTDPHHSASCSANPKPNPSASRSTNPNTIANSRANPSASSIAVSVCVTVGVDKQIIMYKNNNSYASFEVNDDKLLR